jgi:hypothetical protein
VPLKKLGRPHVTRLHARLIDKGRTAKTVANASALLHLALETVVQWRHIPSNPLLSCVHRDTADPS